MKIEENCRTCKWYQFYEEDNEEQFTTDPCIACIRNPDYKDEWELENDIVKRNVNVEEKAP